MSGASGTLLIHIRGGRIKRDGYNEAAAAAAAAAVVA